MKIRSLATLASVCVLTAALLIIHHIAMPHSSRDDRRPLRAADLVGSYYFGDGEGVNCQLDLGQTGRFEFTWQGCLGLYDQNQGIWKLDSAVVHLSCQRPNVREGFQGTPTDFYPVRWGERMYMVSVDEGVEFCNTINSGREPRQEPHGFFYLRQGGWERSVSGLPQVPTAYSGYLLGRPIFGEITSAAPDGRFILNVGRADGVLDKMNFDALRGLSTLTVVSLGEHDCTVAREFPDSDDDEIAVGSPVSTRYWYALTPEQQAAVLTRWPVRREPDGP